MPKVKSGGQMVTVNTQTGELTLLTMNFAIREEGEDGPGGVGLSPRLAEEESHEY